MAMFLWEFEEELMAKALIAGTLNQSLLDRCKELDLQDDITNAFENNVALVVIERLS